MGSFSCHTIAASTGPLEELVGVAQKNWSRASSPAT
jgi:hypothetical protein